MIQLRSYWPERRDAGLSLADHMWPRPPRYDIIQHPAQDIRPKNQNKILKLQLRENKKNTAGICKCWDAMYATHNSKASFGPMCNVRKCSSPRKSFIDPQHSASVAAGRVLSVVHTASIESAIILSMT